MKAEPRLAPFRPLPVLDGAFRAIAGVPIADARAADVVAHLEAMLEAGAVQRLAFLNAHCVNVARRDDAYRRVLTRFLVLPDGIGVDLGALILHGAPYTENLNGTDFVPRLLAEIAPGRRVALVGGRPGVAERAGLALRRLCPGHTIEAVSDGYFDAEARGALLARLAAFRADIVLVALGVPGQETFIDTWLDERHGRLFIGVGALFDFLAGEVPRAPALVRRLRLEWAFRLSMEPGRLFRRYVLGNPAFLLAVLRERRALWRGRA
ncbi:WecB/TagA/CpsF family glycosyltransferase [Aurantimonas sp. Leaf443]|uniref:WecB/TagA/CpsF family glycosyltransferase n=1 Tax=Aurantimonas sp. Leaf443 TaxID=1736378 RepID=UPI0007013E3A|nr:WecB/TagA/CpsF family glycosyltransferase [Aurantimonas sp. Leaf443]KQT87913.1 UDP-N-acetyl-D-mannosaminuronic acid transferase [Aurantimonas sp. Leaf443]